MKKAIVLVVVLFALVAAVVIARYNVEALQTTSSCSSSATNKRQPGIELCVAAFEGAYGSDFWEDIKQGFEKEYADEGYKISIITSTKIEDIIMPQIRNGKGPDVMYLGTNNPSGLTQKLVASHSLLNLNDVLTMVVPGEDIQVKDKIMEGFLDTISTMPYADGDTFMLPLFYSTNGLFYNANLFNEDGSEGKYKLPATWEEFFALGEKAAANGQKLFIYPKAGYLDNFLVAQVASSAGMDVLNDWFVYEDVYQNPDFKKVFENLVRLKPYFAGDIYDAAKPMDNEAQILNNKVLFVTNGSWMPKELARYPKADDFEYGFMPPPAFEQGGDRYCYGMLEQIYALRTGNAEREKASKALLAYMYSDKAVKAAMEKGRAFIPVKGILNIARMAGVDETTLALYGVYDQGAKFVSGNFISANAEGVNWKQTYCFSMDSIIQGEPGCTVQWWIDRMRKDAAKLKKGIQKQ